MPRNPIFVPLTKSAYGVAVKWDNLDGRGLDVDLQAVIVDDGGHIVDAVYYNSLTALQGAMGLMGDSKSGDGDGYDEQIWVSLKKVPKQIKLMIFVVSVYGSGNLADADNGQVVLLEEGRPTLALKIEDNPDGGADVVAMIKRCSDGSWAFLEINEPAEGGAHFLDILEPIGDLIRKEIPRAPRVQKISFVMEKGTRAALPHSSKLKRLAVGIGGTLKYGKEDVDVDIEIAAVFLTKKGELLGAVDAETEGMYGIEHSSHLKAGRHRGDDELITIDIAQIPDKVDDIFIVLTVNKGTFALVDKAYARIVDQSGMEVVRYEIDGGSEATGLVVGQLLKPARGRWTFEALGSYYTSSCGSWRGALGEMVSTVHAQNPQANPQAVPRGGIPSGAGDGSPPAGAILTEKSRASQDSDPKRSNKSLTRSTPSPGHQASVASIKPMSSFLSLGKGSSVDNLAPEEGSTPPESPAGLSRAAVRKGTVRLRGNASTPARNGAPDFMSDSVVADGREEEEGGKRLRPCGPPCCARPSFLGMCAGVLA